MSEELYNRALAKAKEYRGEATQLGKGLRAKLAPKVHRLKDEFLWGVLWSNPAVDLKTRSLCTISALMVLGQEDQLRSHLRCALNVGIAKEQVVSIITQMIFYGGLPTAHNALRVADEVFKEKGWFGEEVVV